MIKAIETTYRGHRFRSRLEARWAVFFDACGIEWKYEDQGYERIHWDGRIDRYLPDFFLPHEYGDGGWFVEVKGDPLALQRQWEVHADRHDFGGILPGFYDCFGKQTGLILIGEIPYIESAAIVCHPVVQHHKGLQRRWVQFTPNGPELIDVDGTTAAILNIECEYGLDYSQDGWLVETRVVPTQRHFPTVFKAYRAARSARFEHGECGAAC